MIFNIDESQIEMYRLCLRYLLSGKSIYYSDNIASRLGDYYSTVDSNTIHEFGKNLYRFLHENYDNFKNIINVIGYNLIRDEYHTISSLPENKYFYFIEPLELINKLDSEKRNSLDNIDIIIISALILETNGGAQFIDYEEQFLNKIVKEPQNTLKIEISFLKFARIISPRSKNITESQKTIVKIKEIIDNRIKKKLAPRNFIHIIQNSQKKIFISLGPSSFRLISLFRTKKDNKKERSDNYISE